jgi:lysophospholipase L1-like esterase
MKRAAPKTLTVLVSIFLGCAPPTEIDLLAPDQGNIGDVIAVRDSAQMTLGTEGSVLFGYVEATGVRKWTPTDIYVEVPAGTSGSVPVRIVRGPQESQAKFFNVVEEDFFPRIMRFGDSLTYWSCFQLQVKMEEDPYLSQFRPLLINHGRRGESVTDPGTLVRWQDALAFCDCDFAVLMHGVNDLTDTLNPENAISLGEIQQSVIRMIDEVAPMETGLILCTLPPRVDACGDSQSPTTEEYNAWLRSYADQRGIPLVDVYEGFVSTPYWEIAYFGGSNCLHPLLDGQSRIAELLNDKIVELYLPACTDLDTDGYGDPAAPPCLHPERDCDDTDPYIHPGIVEASYGDPICSDGLDNDCDGDVDLDDSGCRECTGPEDCDDGMWCNGEEVCAGYACQAGVPPDCDDAIGCTGDACNEETDVCENLPNDALCDDGNPCTHDVCDLFEDCQNACDAAGPEDPCCQDPVCTGAPACEPPA